MAKHFNDQNRYYPSSAGGKKKKRELTQEEKAAKARKFLILIPVVMVTVLIVAVLLGYNRFLSENPPVQGVAPVATNDQQHVPSISDSVLTVVNSAHPLEADQVPQLVEVNGVQVCNTAAQALKQLLADAAAEGVDLSVETGYVSYQDQQLLYEEKKKSLKELKGYTDIKAEAETKKLVPMAGASESQTGLLIAFTTSQKGGFSSSQAAIWLEKHCVNYGFILRYPQKHEDDTGMSYHSQLYRYVGHDNAVRIRSYGMCLNEYVSHVANG